VGSVRLELVKGDALVQGQVHGDGSVQGDAPSTQGSQRLGILDGALRCIARQGVAKLTLDDVAREAKCSRATVYRVFPGGKDALLGAVLDTEVSRFFSALAVKMGEAACIEDVIVAGMSEAARRISEHEALSRLLEQEPEVVLPHLAFAEMDRVLAVSRSFGAPFLGRWLDHDEAHRVAEWTARIVISYLACPADGVDLTDVRDVRSLVRRYVLPGIGRAGDTEGVAAGPKVEAGSAGGRPVRGRRTVDDVAPRRVLTARTSPAEKLNGTVSGSGSTNDRSRDRKGEAS
jgi:AcrR family transcriptional regulator